jgi:hypothetical protein
LLFNRRFHRFPQSYVIRREIEITQFTKSFGAIYAGRSQWKAIASLNTRKIIRNFPGFARVFAN